DKALSAERLRTPPPLPGHGAPDADVVIAGFSPPLPWCSNSSGCGFPMSVLQFPYSSRLASWGSPSLVGGSRGADTVGKTSHGSRPVVVWRPPPTSQSPWETNGYHPASGGMSTNSDHVQNTIRTQSSQPRRDALEASHAPRMA